MSDPTSRAIRRVAQITGSQERKRYADHDEPPSNGRVAMAVVGIQGEVSDQLAMQFEMHRQLVAISRGVWIIALVLVITAARLTWAG